MKLTMESTGDNYRIRGYETGSITINETVVTRTVMLSREVLDPEWGPEQFGDLATEHLDPVLEREPEIVLIGSGATQQWPDRSLLSRTIQAGIGIEVMTTEAACRTYNVLAAEDRHVVALLFMIDET